MSGTDGKWTDKQIDQQTTEGCENFKIAFFQVAAILSSVFISQSISVYMEMFQRRAHQRQSHVFSTAGRSEILPTNSVPEDPQRVLRLCVCARVRASMCVCVCISCICMSVAVDAMMESTGVKCCVHSYPH